MMPEKKPISSLIVPHAGTKTLSLLLESVAVQDIDWQSTEILVVTTAPHNLAKEIIEPFNSSLPIKIVNLEASMSNHTAPVLRNHGAKLASGERLIFVDSDCVLHPKALSIHLNSNDVICGQIRELPANQQGGLEIQGNRSFENLWEKSNEDYRVSCLGYDRPIQAKWSDCYSGNLSIPRHLFLQVGGFDEIGYRCHDMDLGFRLAKIGAKFRFLPECKAIHIEHFRSLFYRVEQQLGWNHLGEKYPELYEYSNERNKITYESMQRTFYKSRKRFFDIIADLNGTVCATVFVTVPNTNPDQICRHLGKTPFIKSDNQTATEFNLRLHRDCWDFSILVPKIDLSLSPKWTVAVPLYNSKKTVGRALESVLRQTRQDFEIIVVDDRSTDGGLCLLPQYLADGRIRVLRNEVNAGLSATLNRALSEARGKYFIQLDSDDWLERNCLEVFDNALSEKEVVAAYGCPRIHQHKRIYCNKGWEVKESESHFTYPYVQAPRAFKTFKLRQIQGWTTNDSYRGRYYEDRLILSRIHELGKVKQVETPVYNVSERKDSLARSNPLEAAAAKLIILSHEAAKRHKTLKYEYEDNFLSVGFSEQSELIQKLWSVIVPHRNQWNFLEYSLLTWIQSDLPLNSEILVVDDFSDESSAAKIEAIDPRIKVVTTNERVGPGRARNLGVSLSKGEIIVFSDADQMVPPNICAAHSATLKKYPEVISCGSIFSRRVFTSVEKSLPSFRKEQLLEISKMKSEFDELAKCVLLNEQFTTITESENLWNRSQQYAVNDAWSSNWGRLILEMGNEFHGYRHKWMRLGTGNVALKRSVFAALNGFDEDLNSKEDWELGIRAMNRGIEIVATLEADTLHQIHPVRSERPQDDLDGAKKLKEKHPLTISAILKSPHWYRPPGYESICNETYRTKTPQDYRADIDEKLNREYALTFDDGPHATGTPKVLELLDYFDVKASFFLLADKISSHRNLCNSIIQKEHEIGLHGWDHTHPTAMTDEKIKSDLRKAFSEISNLLGRPPAYYRPTYGVMTDAAAEVCREFGLKVAGWTVAPKDWACLSFESIVKNIALANPRQAVYLFHDASSDPICLSKVLTWLLNATLPQFKPILLSEFGEKYKVPTIEVEVKNYIGDWKERSLLDLVVRGEI